jgi:hypothetical protein
MFESISLELPSKNPPSLVAAAILMFTRCRINLHFWTSVLESVTGYKEEDVYTCMKEHIEPLWQQEHPHMNHEPIPPPTKSVMRTDFDGAFWCGFGAGVILSLEWAALRGYSRET